jgi:hypothetical protein
MPYAIAGAGVLVVGVMVALALWYLADARRDDAIAGFARAPAGCDTTLLFDTDGRYVLFVETQGTIDDIGGDCETSGDYATIVGVPSFDLAIVGPGGNAVPLGGGREITYDAAGFTGTSVGSVEIPAAGQYVMRVASDDEGFAIAIGTDPYERADALRLGAVVVMVVGVVIGGVLLAIAALGRDRASVAGVSSSPTPTDVLGEALHAPPPLRAWSPPPPPPASPSPSGGGHSSPPPSSPWAPPRPPEPEG